MGKGSGKVGATDSQLPPREVGSDLMEPMAINDWKGAPPETASEHMANNDWE